MAPINHGKIDIRIDIKIVMHGRNRKNPQRRAVMKIFLSSNVVRVHMNLISSVVTCIGDLVVALTMAYCIYLYARVWCYDSFDQK